MSVSMGRKKFIHLDHDLSSLGYVQIVIHKDGFFYPTLTK